MDFSKPIYAEIEDIFGLAEFLTKVIDYYLSDDDSKKLREYKEIIEDYYKTKSARKTALNFGINHSTVDDILNHNNIKRFS